MIEESTLDKYLSNQLSSIEKAELEQTLRNDENLRLRLSVLKSQKSFLKNKEAISKSKAAIGDISQQFRQGRVAHVPKRKSKLLYFIPAAIAALLILGLFIRPLLTATDTSSSALFNQFFEPESLSLLSKGEANMTLEQEAERSFNGQQYAESLTHLQALRDQEPDNDQYTFNLGIAELGAGNAEAAISKLQGILTHPLYGTGAHWYTALSYLKIGERQKTLSYLNKIPAQSSYFSKAQRLVDQLD